MANTSNFMDLMRERILQPRFDALIQHGEDYVESHFEELSIRMAWYNAVKLYTETFKTDVIDVAGKSDDQYKAFEKAIRGFCENKKNVKLAETIDKKFGFYWGLLRKALNIEAKGRAIIFGYSGNNILVVPENKYRYLNKALFLVICEKETLGKKFLAEMESRGWHNHFNLMVTQGFSTCEVIETLMEIKSNIEKGETNFHVGILHDHDFSGHLILHDILRYFPALDFGINFEMLDGIDPNLWDKIKEPVKVSDAQRSTMANFGLSDLANKLGEHRLELDNLFVNRGIGIFADYAEKVIAANIKTVDLNRVTSPDRSQPDAVRDLESKINDLWEQIHKKLFGTSSNSIPWLEPSDDRLKEMLIENRKYTGNLEAIKRYRKHIQNQSAELQDIIDNDPDNLERIEKLRDAVENVLNAVQI